MFPSRSPSLRGGETRLVSSARGSRRAEFRDKCHFLLNASSSVASAALASSNPSTLKRFGTCSLERQYLSSALGGAPWTGRPGESQRPQTNRTVIPIARARPSPYPRGVSSLASRDRRAGSYRERLVSTWEKRSCLKTRSDRALHRTARRRAPGGSVTGTPAFPRRSRRVGCGTFLACENPAASRRVLAVLQRWLLKTRPDRLSRMS